MANSESRLPLIVSLLPLSLSLAPSFSSSSSSASVRMRDTRRRRREVAPRHSNQFPLSSLGDGGDDREGGGRAGKRAGPRRLHQGERDEAFEFPLKRRREGEGTHDFLSKENWGGAGGGERGRRRKGGGGGGGENLCAERADKGNQASEEGGGRSSASVRLSARRPPPCCLFSWSSSRCQCPSAAKEHSLSRTLFVSGGLPW